MGQKYWDQTPPQSWLKRSSTGSAPWSITLPLLYLIQKSKQSKGKKKDESDDPGYEGWIIQGKWGFLPPEAKWKGTLKESLA